MQRGHRRLGAAGSIVALLAACGGSPPPAAPATGLEDLARMTREQPGTGAPVAPVTPSVTLPPGPRKVSEEELARFRADEKKAMQILIAAIGNGGSAGKDMAAALEGLPAGQTQAERLARGLALFQLGLADQAAGFFQDLIREDPRYLPARSGLGIARLRQRKPVEALALLDEVAACWPDHAETRFHRAQALLACGRAQEGEAALASLIPEDVYAIQATRSLASRFWTQNRFAEAREVVEKMLRGRPDHEEVLFLRATLMIDEGDFDGAAEELQKLVAKKPARAVHLLELVGVERARGRFAAATEALARARTEGTPEDLANIGAETLDSIASDLAQETTKGQRVTYTIREVRATLRGSKDRSRRLAALRLLAAAQKPEVVHREVSVYLQDQDPEIRKAALQLLAIKNVLEPREVKAALGDPDPTVRAAAAPLVTVVRQREAVEVLLAVLQKEDDPVAFRAFHERLREISGIKIELVPGAEAKPERRAEIVNTWFDRLAR